MSIANAHSRVPSGTRASDVVTGANAIPKIYFNPAFENEMGHNNQSNRTFNSNALPGAPVTDNEENYRTQQAANFLIKRLVGSESSIRKRTVVFNLALYVFLTMNIFVMAYTDPYSTQHLKAQVFLFCGQFALLVIVCVAFFFGTSQIPAVFLGRYDLYLKRFGDFYAFFVLHFVFFVANKSVQLRLFYGWTPYIAMWGSSGYYPLWILERLFLIALWCAAIRGSLSIMDGQRRADRALLEALTTDRELVDF